MKWLAFAFKNVLRNRRRSLITIVIASVGTAGVLIGGGFALFTYESLREMAARDSGHLVIAHRDYFTHDEDSPMQLGMADYSTIGQRILSDERVRTVFPRIHLSGLISNGDKSAVFVGMGVEAEGEFSVKGPTLRVLSGKLLGTAPESTRVPRVLLGVDLARGMKAAPGTGLTLLSTTTEGSLNALDVVVSGVVSMGAPEVDKRAVITDLATAQRLLATNKVSTLSVYLRNTEDTDAMQAVARSLYPEHAVQTWRDQAFYYEAVKGLYNRIFGLLGIVIVTMVLFAVSNTLVMAVIERTREMGTLRALGASPRQVVIVFVLEGMILGLAGVSVGVMLAVATSVFFALNDFQMPPPPGRSVGYPFNVNMDLNLYALSALIVVLLCIVAAWWVSRKAARKSIVEALAHV